MVRIFRPMCSVSTLDNGRNRADWIKSVGGGGGSSDTVAEESTMGLRELSTERSGNGGRDETLPGTKQAVITSAQGG